ncbi:MAG: fructose bisphosphate aldolase [Eubacteriales bacterium]|nr:fructose bisphosphate aldolase [Eubacteriales bacterium]
MNMKQLERMQHGKGFIAALDQSGGSTPKALKGYGIEPSEYHSDEEMFHLIHQMRTRVITSQSFTSEHILGAILFEMTMDRKVNNELTADYLWNEKGIIPFLKVDKGLDDETDSVQVMKPMPQLNELLKRAEERHIFGTKMRSVIHEANETGIKRIVAQQFELGQKISQAGFVPILEPEVNIHSKTKADAEEILLAEIESHMKTLDSSVKLMFKLTPPSVPGLYSGLVSDPKVVRVVALSGGYSREEADHLLKQNPGVIASFSRALLSELSVKQTPEEFDSVLKKAILEIYEASVS